ncbi:MAG: glycosyltransferase family A protein, partial [Ilumatobacteraceae bacterium]
MEDVLEPDHSGDDGGSVASVPAAPGVVATLVVHPPSATLSECLDSLAAQDYPNLQVLALVTGSDPNEQSSIEEAVRSRGLN